MKLASGMRSPTEMVMAVSPAEKTSRDSARQDSGNAAGRIPLFRRIMEL
jgi:hypothetical protein